MTVEAPFAFIIALAAVNGGAVVALIGVVVYPALRVGRLPTREEHNELRAEVKGDIAEFRREHREDMAQLREDFRRSHQQIMMALVNHSHRDDGQAVFALPPEMEITPAPADDQDADVRVGPDSGPVSSTEGRSFAGVTVWGEGRHGLG